MSKKMLKRSLALGALMAFVITGSAMAAETNQTVTTLPTIEDSDFNGLKNNGLDGINGSSWTAFYPDNVNFDSSDRLMTSGNVEYVESSTGKGNFGLYAAYRIDNNKGNYNQRLDNANDNILEIKHGLTIKQGSIYLYGAAVMYGNDDAASSAERNSVYVGGSNEQITIKTESNGHIFIGGALSNDSLDRNNVGHNVKNNKTIIDNVNFVLPDDKYVCVSGGETRGGDAIDNVIVVKNSTIQNAQILGGFVSYVYQEGADVGSYVGGNASSNTVTLIDVKIEGEKSICAGGYVNTVNGNADGNTMSIEGNSKIAGEFYAGYSDEGNVSNNNITLKDNADVSNAKLYGSNKEGTGNKLVIDENYTGNGQINTVGNFDEIVIDEMKYGEAALTVTEMNYKNADNNGNGGTKLTVNKMIMSGNQELGDTLKVIEATETSGDVSEESKATIYKGTSQILEVGLVNDESGNIKVDEIKKITRNDQVLVIGESRVAATAFTNQGSELIETGIDALARDNVEAGDTKAFAAVYGNASEFATGSHVKVNGWSGIVGIGKTNANGLTVGAFFENGEGNYRTYNTVHSDFMRGDGEACYNGGGLLVRKDKANGVYTEASLRAGNLQNELRNAVRGSEGLTGYDIDTFYYGAHVGIGRVIPRGNEGDSIDVYGKFIYTHHDSEDFTIDGDKFHFDSVDSERLRLGFRINEVQTQKLSMYYGAAWEYEFGGDADNTVVGYDLSTPSLGGSTVIGEIGMHYKASKKWSFDINGRAYAGQRDGFTGSVQANYAF